VSSFAAGVPRAVTVELRCGTRNTGAARNRSIRHDVVLTEHRTRTHPVNSIGIQVREEHHMGKNSLWRLIMIAIAVVIVVSIINYIIRHMLGTIISVAVVVGVLWLILNALTRKKSF
jgi:hypothetical protein